MQGITGTTTWTAIVWTASTSERLWNPERGLFDRRAQDAESDGLLVETMALRDGAVLAGNSVGALGLTELATARFPQFAPYVRGNGRP